MITFDTSGLLGAVDRTAPQHARIMDSASQAAAPFLIPAAILSEIAYMLERGGQYSILDGVLADIERGAYVLDCGDENIPRVRQLMQRYADLPLGLADAFVIACAERNGGQVLSLDRDFRIVSREGGMRVLPE